MDTDGHGWTRMERSVAAQGIKRFPCLPAAHELRHQPSRRPVVHLPMTGQHGLRAGDPGIAERIGSAVRPCNQAELPTPQAQPARAAFPRQEIVGEQHAQAVERSPQQFAKISLVQCQ